MPLTTGRVRRYALGVACFLLVLLTVAVSTPTVAAGWSGQITGDQRFLNFLDAFGYPGEAF